MTADGQNSGARERAVAREWLCKHVSKTNIGGGDFGEYGISMTP
jgi:hypothetical protein